MKKNAEIRSELERRVLPSWFYSWPCDFLNQCIQDPSLPYEVADALFSDAGIRIPYPRDSFSAETVRNDSLFLIVRLTFPVPENGLFFRCAYAVWNRSRKSAEYRCVLQGQPDPFFPLSSEPESALLPDPQIPGKALSFSAPAIPLRGIFRRFTHFAGTRCPLNTALPACAGRRSHAGIL